MLTHTRTLSVGQKAGWGLADMGIVVFVIVKQLLVLSFLTNYLNVPVGIAGLLTTSVLIFDIITDLHLHREHGASPFKQDSKPFIHMVDISPQQSKNHPGKSMIRIWPENGRVLHLETATSYSTSMQTEWNCYWFGSQEKENRSKFSLFQVLTDE